MTWMAGDKPGHDDHRHCERSEAIHCGGVDPDFFAIARNDARIRPASAGQDGADVNAKRKATNSVASSTDLDQRRLEHVCCCLGVSFAKTFNLVTK